jgi:hypothetical protein|uniref:Uncharacterized protein n=1 Tax=viral metagenome TaxID=1070528 RepID=A0A6C0KSL5_9ZZZZ
MLNCDNDLLIFMNNSNKKQCNPPVNKLYEIIFNNIIKKIRKNNEISNEDFDFIESLSCQQKMKIIREFNKKQIENKQILETLKLSELR